ncbi:hypothetical protein TNCT_716641 [Trichonephila clavata]|uniref:Uncharacterized protein n=1 Tax=Trichonephila clavata TaxID=2740835 RepID=A0A8X6FQV6_TRICU|nr:hypothetical protein TNCT_716641 [Trichonephila clavata]
MTLTQGVATTALAVPADYSSKAVHPKCMGTQRGRPKEIRQAHQKSPLPVPWTNHLGSNHNSHSKLHIKLIVLDYWSITLQALKLATTVKYNSYTMLFICAL